MSSLQGKRRTNLETSAPTKDEILNRYFYVVVDDFRVTFGRIIIPENMHRSYHFHTRGISRYDNNALLLVHVGVLWIGLAHDQV